MLADLCDASVVWLDSGDGWAPKSCLPKRLALSLAWKDRPSETLEFVYLRSGAYRDAFVSTADRLLLFKAHLPPGVPYHKVKGSLANDEEYALALNNENHGLPIPHLHGLVGVRVQQDWLGPVDYQLLFQQRIDFTFADWIQAHEGTPPSSDHLTRVVDMILIAVRIMGRLASPPLQLRARRLALRQFRLLRPRPWRLDLLPRWLSVQRHRPGCRGQQRAAPYDGRLLGDGVQPHDARLSSQLPHFKLLEGVAPPLCRRA